MKLKNIKEEDIKLMSLDDLAYEVLKQKSKKMNISDLFKEICDLQELGDKFFEEQIAEFFTLLSTEKRFIQLDKGYWDLSENHTNKISIETSEDIEDEVVITDEQIEEETEEFIDENKDIDDDEDDDDLKDLVILDDNMPEENEL